MTIVLPHGVLFRGGEEGAIRKNLIEQNHIDAVIGLPANIFFGTGIPTVILVLKQKRSNTDVLMVDASKGFMKVGKNNKLKASDIKRITDTVINRAASPKYANCVSRDVIRDNEYNLNIPRYVDSSEDAESWDIYASMFGTIPEQEIHALDTYWQAFPALRDALFSTTSSGQASLKTGDVKNAITHHADVQAFTQTYLVAFGDFDAYLKNALLTPMASLNISKQEAILSHELFARLQGIALIDKYEAYQLLDDSWLNIAIDLEIIQSEGFAACKQVDPYMVTKKKKGKEEVQEGWIGHIMPFELVQKTYLKDGLAQLQHSENRLNEISAEFEEILDSLSEEEKEADTLKDTNDAFVNAAVIKEAKQLRAEIKQQGAFAEDSYEAKILRVDKLIAEEKKLKKVLKIDTEKLHLQTKATIENLSDAHAYELLALKWISPLLNALNKLPETLINELTGKVQSLAEKYATTYADVAEDIQDTEKALSALIDELTGNNLDMQGLAAFQGFLNDE
ncbi:N-6 DNA Methylase [Candidatus Venteria ishoeyi]|uniref:site-specific DNA-methyltransferase (adenine-specific) n=2 Tax=Candidatus Venteria ishoeyi TaxID=1899563 RepID=A0A1H6F7F4_9GAMM|nr:N-6 DNA Methylase [Candidatus Venteria ishoeyi]